MRDELVPVLADIMISAQMRHLKLGLAGRAGNFPLVVFEAQRLQESMTRSAALYANIPVELISEGTASLLALEKAGEARDGAGFNAAYAKLTGACNACHEAAGVPFVKIQAPTGSPFANQDFRADVRAAKSDRASRR